MLYFVIFFICAYAVLFVYKTKTGSPYVPSNEMTVTKMVSYVKPGDVVCDVGAGDGRVLAAAIHAGANEAWGWEIEPLIWLRGWLRYRNNPRIHLLFGDMWRADFSRYNVVFVYQLEEYSARFAAKVKREMRPGTLVISNTYRLFGLSLERRDDSLFVYRV